MSWGDAAGQGIGAGGELTLAEETFVQGLAGIAFQTGDLIYYNGTALTRLGIGSASQVLTVSSGLPAWAAASAGGGASDHGDLTGLADDDHTQYALNTHSYVTVAAEARFTAERVLTGTANQITITDGGAGTTVTLATPQDIHTAASPQFTALNIGHATDTTLARSGAGDLTIEGNAVYRVGGTDVAVADGGTGASTAAGARSNLAAAPNTATYVTISTDAELTVERTLAGGAGLTLTDGGAGAAVTLAVGAGSGITVNADDVAVNQGFAFAWTAAHTHTVAGLVKTNTNTTDGASVQVAIFEGDRATMADADEAYLTLRLSNDGGTQTEFARLTWVATDVNAATSVDGRLDFAVVTAGTLADELQLDGTALSPSTTDGLALGTSALNFADLFLDLAAVINFDSGDVTLTHAANRLTIAGGEFDLGGATDNILVAGADPKKSFFIHAAGMWPSTTSGSAALAKVELATNKVNYQSLDFDQTAQEFAEFALQMPDNWDASTLTFRVAWTASAGTGAVVWELQATALANDDAIDTAWGTAVEVTDTLIATSDMHDTGESGAVTVGNTPAAGEWVQFRIARDPANASDTLTADARLTGVRVEYGIGQYNQ